MAASGQDVTRKRCGSRSGLGPQRHRTRDRRPRHHDRLGARLEAHKVGPGQQGDAVVGPHGDREQRAVLTFGHDERTDEDIAPLALVPRFQRLLLRLVLGRREQHLRAVHQIGQAARLVRGVRHDRARRRRRCTPRVTDCGPHRCSRARCARAWPPRRSASSGITVRWSRSWMNATGGPPTRGPRPARNPSSSSIDVKYASPVSTSRSTVWCSALGPPSTPDASRPRLARAVANTSSGSMPHSSTWAAARTPSRSARRRPRARPGSAWRAGPAAGPCRADRSARTRLP